MKPCTWEILKSKGGLWEGNYVHRLLLRKSYLRYINSKTSLYENCLSSYVQLPFICTHHSTISLFREVSSSSGLTGMRQSNAVLCWYMFQILEC